MTKTKIIHGWIGWGTQGEVAGAFRTDAPGKFGSGRDCDDWKRATIAIEEECEPETKTVYQWRYRKANGAWTIAKNLYTESEAGDWGVKHAGPFEVEV